MSEQMLQAAQREEAVLLAELRQHPSFVKLEAVRFVISVYGKAGTRDATGVERQQDNFASRPTVATKQIVRQHSVPAKIAEAAETFLRKANRRAPVSEIAEAFKESGFEIEHDQPMTYLSGVLSKSSLFDNVRGQGYGLVEWHGRQSAMDGDQSAPNPATEHDASAKDAISDDQMKEMLG